MSGALQWVKGDPLSRFEAGRTYVVEFWATWCGPCKRGMPHLSELQREYARDVTVIGVSIWERDPEEVEPFVEEMGEIMAYTVAKDLLSEEGGAMATSWMEAADRDGIPSAFIVDGKGRIAWIGHPMTMDEPLGRIVAGEWDLEGAAKEHRTEREREARRRVAMERIDEAHGRKDWKAIVAAIDEAVAGDPALELELGATKFWALLGLKAFDRAYGYCATLVDGIAQGEAGLLNTLAWMIVDPKSTPEQQDLDLALRTARRASELTGGKDASILDTLARVHFERGELGAAIEVQGRAVALAEGTNLQGELELRLEEYERAAGKRGV